MPEGEAIEAGIVTRSIESAQRKVEARNFDIRKQLLEYDDVSNDQRKVIYQQRNDILEASDLDGADRQRCAKRCCTDLVRQLRAGRESVEEQWDLAGLEKVLRDEWELDAAAAGRKSRRATPSADEDIVEKVVNAGHTRSSTPRCALIGAGELHAVRAHGAAAEHRHSTGANTWPSLDYLRQGIHLRGYAQKQPKQEYKREAFELFGQLLDSVKIDVTRQLMTVRMQIERTARGGRRSASKSRAESLTNITYTAPNEDGRSRGRVDEESRRRRPPVWPDAGAAASRAWAATIRARAAAARSTSSATASSA